MWSEEEELSLLHVFEEEIQLMVDGTCRNAAVIMLHLVFINYVTSLNARTS